MKRDALYAPEPGDLVHRVCTYLAQSHHRGEALTARDVAEMFEVATSHIVRSQLAAGVYHGYLVEVNRDGGAYFEPGPRIEELQAIPTTKQIGVPMATLSPNVIAPPAKKKIVRTRLPPLDASKLKVEQGVAIPSRQQMMKGQTRYDDLFNALQPDCSCAVPVEYAAALRKAVESRVKLHGGKYVVRVMSDTEARIWRTE